MKKLLSIVELAAHPDFSSLYSKCGYSVTTVHSMRKGLAAVKKICPDVIVAQFIYSPTYGSQLSNFEALIATIQSTDNDIALIAFLEKENVSHFAKINQRIKVSGEFTYPINIFELMNCLNNNSQ